MQNNYRLFLSKCAGLFLALCAVFFTACVDGELLTWPTFIVSYHPNGGLGTMEDSEHRHGVSSNLSANVFTRAGHMFDGWARSPGGLAEFSDRQNVTNLTERSGETVTLYAVWFPIGGFPPPLPPPGGAQQITVTVTGIPSRYINQWGFIELISPQTMQIVAFSDEMRITASTTFTMRAFTSPAFNTPGTYAVFLGFDDNHGSPLADYIIPSRSITAGSNTIPFNAFNFVPWDFSEDLDQASQRALPRSRVLAVCETFFNGLSD